jgi:hypothetical protein
MPPAMMIHRQELNARVTSPSWDGGKAEWASPGRHFFKAMFWRSYPGTTITKSGEVPREQLFYSDGASRSWLAEFFLTYRNISRR